MSILDRINAWMEAPAPDSGRPAYHESTVPVQVYQKRLYCRCYGQMTYVGGTTNVGPALYTHKCDTCGAVVHVGKRYPIISYEELPRRFGAK